MTKRPIGVNRARPGFLSWALRQPSPKKNIYLQFFSGTPIIECARDLGLSLADVRAALLELRDKRLAFAEDELRMAFLAAKSKAEFCGVTGQTEGVYDLLQIRFGEQAMTGFNCPRTGNQLMVDSLINFRLATLFCQPHAREWRV